jgi:hypothetical protein
MIPIWSKAPRCPLCLAPAGRRHGGQHGGIRYRECPACAYQWHESPLGFIVWRDGVEVLVSADELDEASQVGKADVGSVMVPP